MCALTTMRSMRSGGAGYAVLSDHAKRPCSNTIILKSSQNVKSPTNFEILASNQYIGPALSFVALAILCPFAVALLLSFAGGGQLTFAGYAEVLSARRMAEYKTILLRAVAVATACQMIALPVAYWLVRLRF